MLLHLDTDIGGDPDDACALAMVLGWPDVELAGITTVADPDGQRAGYAARLLELAGRTDVPVRAGAGISSTTGREMGGIPDHDRYWGPPAVAPRPGPADAARDLLAQNLDRGATVMALGPYTNLAALGPRLSDAPVVAMGGWLAPPAPELPAWGPDMDWNVQCDTGAARTLLEQADLTLVPLPVAMPATLRAADLPRLEASGPLGAAVARASRAHGLEYDNARLGLAHPGLPDDLVNFHWDPVACAVALGWSGATVEPMRLGTTLAGDVLRFVPDPAGPTVQVVTAIEAAAFGPLWIEAVERA